MTDVEAPPHPFDTALDLTPVAPGRWRGRTTPAWANMVGPFGGITAAALVRAVQLHPQVHGDPLALTVNYAGPIADGDFEIAARPMRTNRTNQHWALEITQGEAVTTTGTAVFGLRRDTWTDTEARMPAAPDPATVAAEPFPEFIAWARNYDMRFVTGPVPTQPGTEHPDSTSTLWVRAAPARALDYPALAALCDVFYPRVFLRLGRYVPAGTVSLTTYFHAEPGALAAVGAEFVLATARAQRFGRGYADQTAQLFGRSGELLATTHQLVYFKS
ncbi:thioesterase family protein [uncultured Mycolicibacterium sp.]|uniref:acyl-CoA thioesterase n=1 Tax=uncultured Mycolicibacterium sp. TaxID=2320817 RepID=UPI0026271272|nr:thioesterase family protein [uncultured Mycolicibacterium sp.]